MVDEYIRRQEMLEAVDHLHIIPSIDGTGKPTPTEDFRVQFIGTVLKVKSADVVQVVHGRWVKYTGMGKEQWMCSECCAEEKNTKIARYCYHCGAKMDREE